MVWEEQSVVKQFHISNSGWGLDHLKHKECDPWSCKSPKGRWSLDRFDSRGQGFVTTPNLGAQAHLSIAGVSHLSRLRL